ncbi:hypothetical protein SDC9_190303 [bioreactor metagenome]|uniref:Uncharacterized protein n=1 Tax=bioreactor metagenome TaxID=1076179 RepID=A0A645HVZ6_9ZZZZ
MQGGIRVDLPDHLKQLGLANRLRSQKLSHRDADALCALEDAALIGDVVRPLAHTYHRERRDRAARVQRGHTRFDSLVQRKNNLRALQ